MARAAEQVAVSAGKLNANVEIATNETAKKLGEALQQTFTTVVTDACEMHADKIGARLNEQNQTRLDLARDTVASLTVLKTPAQQGETLDEIMSNALISACNRGMHLQRFDQRQ